MYNRAHNGWLLLVDFYLLANDILTSVYKVQNILVAGPSQAKNTLSLIKEMTEKLILKKCWTPLN